MNTRKRSQSVYWSEGVAGLIPFADELEIGIYWTEAEGKIAINIVVRGGGRFDPS